MFVNRVDTLPRVCNNADMAEIRVTPNTELRGAAIRYYDFERIMPDEWCDLVNDALDVVSGEVVDTGVSGRCCQMT